MQHYIYVYIQYILIGHISRGHPISSGRKVCIRPLWSHQAQKKTEFWANITTEIAIKNLFKTLETYLFSVSGAVFKTLCCP